MNDSDITTRTPAQDAAPQAAPKVAHMPTLANVTPMLGSGQRAVSRKDAGKMLGVSWRTIERLVDRGELRAFKPLGQWRILVTDIDAFVARQILERKTRIGA